MPRGRGRRDRPPDHGSRYEPLGRRVAGRQPVAEPARPPAAEPAERDRPPKRAGVCWLFNSQEGCRFGDACKFEHAVSEACMDFALGRPCSRTPCRFRHVRLCTAIGCSGADCQLAHARKGPQEVKLPPFPFGPTPAPWAPKAASREADWDPILRLAIFEADEAVVRAEMVAGLLRCLGQAIDGFPLPPGGLGLPGAVGCPDCGEVLSLRGSCRSTGDDTPHRPCHGSWRQGSVSGSRSAGCTVRSRRNCSPPLQPFVPRRGGNGSGFRNHFLRPHPWFLWLQPVPRTPTASKTGWSAAAPPWPPCFRGHPVWRLHRPSSRPYRRPPYPLLVWCRRRLRRLQHPLKRRPDQRSRRQLVPDAALPSRLPHLRSSNCGVRMQDFARGVG